MAIVAAPLVGYFADEKALEIAGCALLVAGVGTLGVRLLRMSDDDWDAAPATAAAPPE